MIWITEGCHQLFDVRQELTFTMSDGTVYRTDPVTLSGPGMDGILDDIETGGLVCFSTNGELTIVRGHDVVKLTFRPVPDDA